MSCFTSEKLILASFIYKFKESNFQKVIASHFVTRASQMLYNEIKYLRDTGSPVSYKSVTEAIRERICQKDLPEIAEVMHYIKNFYADVDFDYHYQVLDKERIRTEAISSLRSALKALCEEEPETVLEISTHMNKLAKIMSGQSTESYKMEELVQNFEDGLDYIQTLKKRRANYCEGISNFNGLPTGYKQLDATVGGFAKGTYNIIAASTSAGKTTYMMNCMMNMMRVNPDSKILFITLEMTPRQIFEKLIGAYAQIDSKRLVDGNITKTEQDLVEEVVNAKRNCSIVFDGSVPADINYIFSKTSELIRETGCDIVFIDYLTLIKPTGKFPNKHLEIDSLSKGLQHLAKKLNVPIVALAQLNRSLNNRLDSAPQLQDIRESGSIAEDADLVIMIDRPNRGKENDLTNVYIRKNRIYGTLGFIQMEFDKGRLIEIDPIQKKMQEINSGTDEFSQFSRD